MAGIAKLASWFCAMYAQFESFLADSFVWRCCPMKLGSHTVGVFCECRLTVLQFGVLSVYIEDGRLLGIKLIVVVKTY